MNKIKPFANVLQNTVRGANNCGMHCIVEALHKQIEIQKIHIIVFFKSLCTNPSFCYNSPNFQPNDLIFGDIRAVNKMFTKF